MYIFDVFILCLYVSSLISFFLYRYKRIRVCDLSSIATNLVVNIVMFFLLTAGEAVLDLQV